MLQIISVFCLLLWFVLVCGYLFPQYNAWRNKCYKTLAIALISWLTFVVFGILFAHFGGFTDVMLYGDETAARTADDAVLFGFGMPFILSGMFCWYYIYGRHSADYIYIRGLTHEQVKKTISDLQI